MNNLKKFIDSETPKTHQAQPGIGGQIKGIHQAVVGKQFVIAENTGIHSSIFNQSQIRFPKRVGSLPGANGAQFIGLAIHHQPEKPQLNQSSIFCISFK